MWLASASFNMTDIVASGNSVESRPGGAIHVNDGDLMLSSSTFTDNTPSDINVERSAVEIISMSTVESLHCESGTSNLGPSSTIDLVMCLCECGGTACGCVEGGNFDPDKNCSDCIDGFYDLDCCSECTTNCNGHGLCDGTASPMQPTTCVCDSNFNSSTNCGTCVLGFDQESNCGDCESDFFGLDCQPCPDTECGGHGQCEGGVDGDGSCICEDGFDPSTDCESPITSGVALTRVINHWVLIPLVLFALNK